MEGPPYLWHLSDDCLSSISDLLSAHEVTRLYFCGHIGLCNRLQRAVRLFRLNHVERRLISWPRILSCFRALQYVRISTFGNSSSSYVTAVDLTVLPSTLQSLDLRIANGFLCLLEMPPFPSGGPNYKPRLSSDLIHRCPNLTSLSWSNMYSGETMHWDISDLVSDLSRFRHLCDIHSLHSLLQRWTWPSLAELPSTLQNMTIPRIQIDATSTPTFPASLTTLRLYSPDTIPFEFLRWLPTSLVHLNLLTNVGGGACDWTALSRLSNLTRFRFLCASFDEHLVIHLPRSLRHLDVRPNQLWFDSLALLPNGLCSLVLQFIDLRYALSSYSPRAPNSSSAKSINHVSANLPRSLTKISSQLFSAFPPSTWKNLPRGLAELHATGERPMVDVQASDAPHLADLPPALQSLRCHDLPTSNFAFLSNTPSLTILSLSGIDAEGSSPKELLTLVSNTCPQLSRLTLALEGPVDSQWFEHFQCPIEQLSFKLESYTDQVPEERRPLLQQLFAPHLGRPVASNMAEIEEGSEGIHGGKDVNGRRSNRAWFRHLQILEINEYFTAFMDTPLAWIQSLPSSLTMLNIPTWRSASGDTSTTSYYFPTETLAHLPPSLTHLEIRIAKLDSKYFAYLPRQLKIMTIFGDGGRWRWDDLHQLPRTLHRIYLPSPTAASRLSSTVSFSDAMKQLCLQVLGLRSLNVGRSAWEIEHIAFDPVLPFEIAISERIDQIKLNK